MKHLKFKSPIPNYWIKKKFAKKLFWALRFGVMIHQIATNLIPTINSLTKMPTLLKRCMLMACLMLMCLNFSIHISALMAKNATSTLIKYIFLYQFILFFVYIFKIYSPFLGNQKNFHFYFLNFYFYFRAISS